MALFSFNLLTPVREAYGVHTGWALLRAGRVQGVCRACAGRVQGECRACAGACCLLVPPTSIICWWAARRVRWEQMHFRASPTRIMEGVHQVSPQEILPEETLKSPARTRRAQ